MYLIFSRSAFALCLCAFFSPFSNAAGPFYTITKYSGGEAVHGIPSISLAAQIGCSGALAGWHPSYFSCDYGYMHWLPQGSMPFDPDTAVAIPTNYWWTWLRVEPSPGGPYPYMAIFYDPSPPVSKNACGDIGNPIGCGSGIKYSEMEYDIGEFASIPFSRRYSSAAGLFENYIGVGWSATYFQRIIFSEVGGLQIAFVRRPNGQEFFFKKRIGDLEWKGDKDINFNLKNLSSGGFVLWVPGGGAEIYDANGRLNSIKKSTGGGYSLFYNEDSRLEKVVDSQQREIKFLYQSGLLSSVISSSGYQVDYAYDSDGNLVSVTHPHGVARKFHYNESIHTDGANLPHALTGITDELGVRYSVYKYNVKGKAVSTELANSVLKYTLSYSDYPKPTTVVVDPLGTVRTFKFSYLNGVYKTDSISLPCQGCGGTFKGAIYDSHGNMTRQTDFNNTVTTYTYDLARNLEIQRVEASGTAEQRTVSTQWHSLLRLPSARAEPGRITYWVYDGQIYPGGIASCTPGDALITTGVKIAVVCERTEQATTDQSGAAGFAATPSGTPRTTTYTYDRYGNVLTENGPRTDVNDLTTYTYYGVSASCSGASEGTGMDKGCRGQLKQVQNAVGHTTQYLKYNAYGQPLQVRDANGSDSIYTYDVRGRLTGRNEQGRLTTYEYDPRGLLTRIVLPGGGQLIQHYDAAHRLVALADGLGNRIDYTLDAAGNRTRETVQDPAQTLRQAVTREFDALSRLTREYKGI